MAARLEVEPSFLYAMLDMHLMPLAAQYWLVALSNGQVMTMSRSKYCLLFGHVAARKSEQLTQQVMAVKRSPA